MSFNNMDITSPQIDAGINALEKEVKNYVSGRFGFMPSIKFNKVYLYVSIPIIIFIMLIIWRPKFVKNEVRMESGETQLKTSISKIFMWSLGLGTVIVVGIYAAYRS